jgi:potassium-transporting ATPase potassium-binding subunit
VSRSRPARRIATIVALVVVMALACFLAAYTVSVYEGRTKWLAFIERPIYRIIGVDAAAEQPWQRYGASMIVYSGLAILICYLFFGLQGHPSV